MAVNYKKTTSTAGGLNGPKHLSIVAEDTIEGFGTWTLDEKGLLRIEGKGTMPNWKWDSDIKSYTPPWYSCRPQIRFASLSNGITHIGNGAFCCCSRLTQIDLPASVTHIGIGAFAWCKNLTQLDIPDSVTYIGGTAFLSCDSLTQLDISRSVINLDKDVFYGCTNLRKVTMSARFNRLFFKSYYGIPKDIVTFF